MDAHSRLSPPAGAAAPGQPAAPPVLWKVYLAFLVPMIASNFLQALSGTVNNIYLGQMLGVGAMASVSAFFPVLFFLISFMIGLGSGAAVLIGQAWGAKELDRVQAIAGTTVSVGYGTAGQRVSLQISGVSIDEEAAMLLRFQRSYEANAKFFQVADQTLDLLMSLVRT